MEQTAAVVEMHCVLWSVHQCLAGAAQEVEILSPKDESQSEPTCTFRSTHDMLSKTDNTDFIDYLAECLGSTGDLKRFGMRGFWGCEICHFFSVLCSEKIFFRFMFKINFF